MKAADVRAMLVERSRALQSIYDAKWPHDYGAAKRAGERITRIDRTLSSLMPELLSMWDAAHKHDCGSIPCGLCDVLARLEAKTPCS